MTPPRRVAGGERAPYFLAGQYFWKYFISGGGWFFWIGMM
jgi:hypothetical protein